MSDYKNFEQLDIRNGFLLAREAAVLEKASRGTPLLEPDQRSRRITDSDRQSVCLANYVGDTLHGNRAAYAFDSWTFLIVNFTPDALSLTGAINDKYGTFTGRPADGVIPPCREGCPALGVMTFHKTSHAVFTGESTHGMHFGFAFAATASMPSGMTLAGILHYKTGNPPVIQLLAGINVEQAMKDVSNKKNGAGSLISRSSDMSLAGQSVKNRMDASLQKPGHNEGYLVIVSVSTVQE